MFATLFGVSIVIVVFTHLLPWLLLGAVMAGVVWMAARIVKEHMAEAAAEQRRKAAIRRRADEQRNAMMSGDTGRGVYRSYPPARIRD